jgi:hypothetical protein
MDAPFTLPDSTSARSVCNGVWLVSARGIGLGLPARGDIVEETRLRIDPVDFTQEAYHVV